ncbi:MAG TPA: tetratricopeptide repeat protein [Arenicellales bacterium]|nr:tetratricopeptide repeat protein [Arenicellales bacterium]
MGGTTSKAHRSASLAVAAVFGLLAALAPVDPARGNPGITSSGSSSEPAAIDQALGAIEDGKYRRAVRHLEKHLKKNRDDADALNLMGYSLRKLERAGDSERYYLRALEIEPGHLGANEYLGELYLHTGRPELARERLAVLERACPDSCEEREELAEALQSYLEEHGQ